MGPGPCLLKKRIYQAAVSQRLRNTGLEYSMYDIIICLFPLKEYEKCEDYWAKKLDEERHLYDQEQKLSDEKFSELMSKIREYEEMLGAQEDSTADSDRLSTIEERGSLEKQVIIPHKVITFPVTVDLFQYFTG